MGTVTLRVVVAVIWLALAGSASAHAQPAGRQPASPEPRPLAASPDRGAASGERPPPLEPVGSEPGGNWYGGALMVSDGLSVAGFTAGALLWMPCFTIFGPAREAPGCDLGGVMMGTSMVTLALVPATIHLFHGQPLAALGSIGVRALAVGVTAVAPDDNRVSVFLFAGLAAIIIDWTVLAREDTERPHDTGTFSPTLQLDQHGGALGVQGAF